MNEQMNISLKHVLTVVKINIAGASKTRILFAMKFESPTFKLAFERLATLP